MGSIQRVWDSFTVWLSSKIAPKKFKIFLNRFKNFLSFYKKKKQIQAGKIQTPEQTKQINDQLDRINKLFKQELNVGLQAGEKTLKEFSEFDETQIDSELKKSFDKSKQTYKKIESYELALVYIK